MEWRDAGEDELFETANFYPRDTGLPMTVWVDLNSEVLIDYWDGRTSTVELVGRLRKV